MPEPESLSSSAQGIAVAVAVVAVLALAAAFVFRRQVLAAGEGTERMQAIAVLARTLAGWD